MSKKTGWSDDRRSPEKSSEKKPYQVGPNCPPLETRWRKGDPSPNPKGRPPKSHLGDLFAKLEPHMMRILDFDQKVIGQDSEGKPITRGDSIDAAFAKMTLQDFKAMQLYLERRDMGFERMREFKQNALIAAVEHIDRYLPRALELEAVGKSLKTLPHPLDVIIEQDSVRIVGPVTEYERLAMKEAIRRRNNIHKIVREDLPGCGGDEAARLEVWKGLRRQHYRLSRVIPPRLKVKFPPFQR